MAHYKPTPEDCRIIRQYALAESRRNGNSKRTVHIEPGIRVNIKDDSKPIDMNLRLVSNDPDWSDTDLHDTGSWADFRRGIELSAAGEAEIDFYLYEPLAGDHGDLCCNLQAIFDANGLKQIDADSDTKRWVRAD